MVGFGNNRILTNYVQKCPWTLHDKPTSLSFQGLEYPEDLSRVLHFTLVTKAHEENNDLDSLVIMVGVPKITTKRNPIHVSKALVTQHSVKHIWT